MVIGILKEPPGEARVSLLPEGVRSWSGGEPAVWVEEGAGAAAFAADEAYREAGAQLRPRSEILSGADLILAMQAGDPALFSASRPGTVWVGAYDPLYRPEAVQTWAEAGLTVFSLDQIPRSTRAQSMDVRSSQANIAGYKAVLAAADRYGRYFPMLMTAAGSIPPAKVLVLGAGVAGLQAIATARRLGAVVEVFDTRPAVKEEVMSLGARFVEVEGAADASGAGGYAVEQSEAYKQRQQERIAESIAKADIVITTAQIPGKPAPVLVTRAMMDRMREGSVIIDLASGSGGNTEVTKDREEVRYKGVRVYGEPNLAGTMPSDASRLYGKNILNFLKLIMDGGSLRLNFEDELVSGTCMTHEGQIVNERIRSLLAQPT